MPAPTLPIPKKEYNMRLSTVREELRASGYTGLMAFSGYAERDGNVCYLCGHKNAFPYSTKTDQVSGLGYSALLVPTDGETTLIAPLGYQPDAVVGVDRNKTGTNLARDLVNAIRETLADAGKLAIAGGDVIPAIYIDELRREFPQLSLEYRESLLTEPRMRKSENELKLLRHASRIADKAMMAAIDAIKPGISESAVGSVARKAAMDAGADYVVRDRVYSGREMGKLRWPFASRKKIRRGELVAIDFVGWANSYGFDILRVGSAGRMNREQRRLIEVAGEATAAMSEKLVDGNEIESSLSMLRKFEKDGFTVSPFGHGIGLEIVENPYLFPGVSGKLSNSMVLCIEPAVRWKNNYASVENEIVVTSRKPEVLTKLPIIWD